MNNLTSGKIIQKCYDKLQKSIGFCQKPQNQVIFIWDHLGIGIPYTIKTFENPTSYSE